MTISGFKKRKERLGKKRMRRRKVGELMKRRSVGRGVRTTRLRSMQVPYAILLTPAVSKTSVEYGLSTSTELDRRTDT